ncbi:InlB B-repeat-containing protein [Tenacibaculum jejuense]|uniref:InlB B-repeat-containing protein n=1 Tax=Tenacibaculum jejuense TaxID=584609 RepID=UPI001E4D11EF|nr:choice-of-anchor Q domain-containing protein [Tenacibaculum jejuense]
MIVFIIASLFFSHLHGQTPLHKWDFTNGSLLDTGSSITKSNFGSSSSLITVTDADNNVNSAIDLSNNANVITGPVVSNSPLNLSIGKSSLNEFYRQFLFFNVKTSTNDSNKRVILSQKSTSSNNNGFEVSLQNGKVVLETRIFRDGAYRDRNGTHPKVISDGNWHRIGIQVQYSRDTNTNKASNIIRIYVDNVVHQVLNIENFSTVLAKPMGVFIDDTSELVIGNNQSFSKPINDRYSDILDSIEYYVETTNDNKNIDPFIDLPKSVFFYRSARRVYVDVSASGTNDGTSWQNAYRSMYDAANFTVPNDEVWIAKGRYVVGGTQAPFTFSADARIYGGFNGTETTLNQRDFNANVTTFTGDRNNNDNEVSEHNDSFRNENTYNILRLNANCIVDGITFTGGHAYSNVQNDTNEFNRGAAIHKADDVTSLVIRNCKFLNNLARVHGTVYANFASNSVNNQFIVSNCKFSGNVSRFGSAISLNLTGGDSTLDADITNSLFYNNTAKDLDSRQGFGGTILANCSGPTGNKTFNLNINNCTLTKNTEAVNNNLNTATPIRVFKASNPQYIFNVAINNTIITQNVNATPAKFFYSIAGNNGTADRISSLSLSYTKVDETASGGFSGNSLTSEFSHIVDASNFSENNNLDSSKSVLFNDFTNNDFTLNATDTDFIDAGNNSLIPSNSTTDLSGNNRIHNTSVDIGTYEFGSSSVNLKFLTTQVNGNEGSVNPVSGSAFVDGTSATINAIPNKGYEFDSWSGDVSGSTNPITVTMNSDKTVIANFKFKIIDKVYVDENATGANDGSSWQDAYTKIQDALDNLPNRVKEIWIAKGTYTPHTSSRLTPFLLDKENIKIFGGFSGNETLLADRDMSLIHTTNATVLSGDLAGNDNSVISFNNTTRSDNSLRVINVTSDGVDIDGVTISGGNAIGTGNNRFGSALGVNNSVNNFTMKNSRIINNISVLGALNLRAQSSNTINYIIDACIFENNLSSNVAAGIYVFPEAKTTMNFTLTNSLFSNNRTVDNGAAKGHGLSAVWVRSFNTGSVINPVIVNNTFVNNKNEGTGVSDFATFGLSQQSGTFGTVSIANNIFWGNVDRNGNTTKAFGKRTDTALPSGLTISNSIDEDGFSNIASSSLISTSNVDPLFTDSNNDFTLQSSSLAINGGLNSAVPSNVTADLLGNSRIFDSTVDIGAYESNAVTQVQRTLTINSANGSVSTNPNATGGTYDDGTSVELTATPAAGYQFDGWSGDATGTTNPLSITMDADKTITAIFSRIQRTLTVNATNGTVTISNPFAIRGINNTPTTGQVDDGTTLRLTATPDAGYKFDGWSGDITSTVNPVDIIMDADKTVTAMFSAVTASVVDEEFDREVKIYPVPTSYILNIEVSSGNEIKQLVLYSVVGKKVIESKERKINLSSLVSGIYILKVTNLEGRVASKRIIKK